MLHSNATPYATSAAAVATAKRRAVEPLIHRQGCAFMQPAGSTPRLLGRFVAAAGETRVHSLRESRMFKKPLRPS